VALALINRQHCAQRKAPVT